jgi:hypothetical protein
MAQTPSSRYVALNSADALRTSGSVAPTGLPRDSIPQIRRAPTAHLANTVQAPPKFVALGDFIQRLVWKAVDANPRPKAILRTFLEIPSRDSRHRLPVSLR